MRVCVRARAFYFKLSNPDNSRTAWDIDMKIGTPVKQSQTFNFDDYKPVCTHTAWKTRLWSRSTGMKKSRNHGSVIKNYYVQKT